MPSQNMLPKGKRRQSVKNDYRAQRTLIQENDAARRAAGEEPLDPHTMEMVDTAEFTPKPSPFAHMPGLVTSGPSGGKTPAGGRRPHPRRYAAPRVPSEPAPEIEVLEDLEPEDGVRTLTAPAAAADMRLDAYLAKAIPDISRARVQLLTEKGQVTVDGKPANQNKNSKAENSSKSKASPSPNPSTPSPKTSPSPSSTRTPTSP